MAVCDRSLLGWLFNPAEEYAPHTLKISAVDTRFFDIDGGYLDRDPRPFLGRLSRHVTKLMLTGYFEGIDISSIIGHFPNLRSFCLCLNVYTSIPPINFPESVHRFQIHFASQPDDQDQTLVSLLRDAQHIREVYVSFAADLDYDYEQTSIFSSTAAYCNYHGVEFSVVSKKEPPSYLDL